MTNGYVINIGNASGKQWVSLGFEKTLNGISNAQIGLDGVNNVYAAEFDTEKDFSIYKNGNLKFKGTTTLQSALTGGGIVLTALGIEHELADDTAGNLSVNQVWTSTSANTIFTTLVTAVSGWTVDVTNSTGTVIGSFRVSISEYIWNAVIRLIEQTGKDIWVDQANKKLYLYDELTRNNKFSFIEGKNAKDIGKVKSRSKAGKVIVYGKGDGEDQIIGSSGASTPVVPIIDRNILTVAEANTRATVEYNKLNPNSKQYSLTPIVFVDDLEIGDSGKLNNNSAGIDDTVDIVRIKTVVDGAGTEKVIMQVTNPDYRLANKNNAENNSSQGANYLQSQASMQGSGNTLTWGGGINANSGASMKLSFNIPSLFVEDEVGNIRVNSMTLDYDIDPFKQQYGTASFDGTDPQVQNSSANTQPDVSGTSGNTQPDLDQGSSSIAWSGSSIGTDSGNNISCSSGTWNTIASVSTTGSNDALYANFSISGDSGGPEDISVRVVNTGIITATDSVWETYSDGFRDIAHLAHSGISVSLDGSSDAITLQVYPHTGAIVIDGFLGVYKASHEHSFGDYGTESHPHNDGSYTAADHPHNDGSYDINAADIDNISISDDVSDAGSVNATEIDIYLDFWNETTWINKHSVLNTGKTIDTNVDISDGGTYPDAVGYWRARIVTNSASSDFVQGIIKIKHNLDN